MLHVELYVVSLLFFPGLVGGDVHLRKYNLTESTFSSEVVEVTHKHHDVVRRLAFRPLFNGNTKGIYLASCSNDNRVQIYKVNNS